MAPSVVTVQSLAEALRELGERITAAQEAGEAATRHGTLIERRAKDARRRAHTLEPEATKWLLGHLDHASPTDRPFDILTERDIDDWKRGTRVLAKRLETRLGVIEDKFLTKGSKHTKRLQDWLGELSRDDVIPLDPTVLKDEDIHEKAETTAAAIAKRASARQSELVASIDKFQGFFHYWMVIPREKNPPPTFRPYADYYVKLQLVAAGLGRAKELADALHRTVQHVHVRPRRGATS